MNALRPLVLGVVLQSLGLAGCRGPRGATGEQPPEGLPAVSATVWTDRTELFLEYEPPVVAREGKFGAHVTDIGSFKPVTQGEATLTLTQVDGTQLTSRADAPSSPGIFRARIKPTVAGKCTLALAVEGAQVQDRIDAGACEVFADEAAAVAAAARSAEAAGVNFTKEQQWKTEFATAAVAERELQVSVQANAEIIPVAGKEAKLIAPAAGRIALATPTPIIGMTVSAGQLLATVSPRLGSGTDRASLEAEVQAVRAEQESARLQLARAERLFSEQAIPERQLDESRARMQVAVARTTAAEARLVQYGSGGGAPGSAMPIRAPLAGTLVLAQATSGESVEEGRVLFGVIDLSRLWLQAKVFEPDIPKVEGARSAWFTLEGYDETFVVGESNGKLVTVGRVIDPRSRTVPVIFELDNPGGRLRIGQFAKVHIATGAALRLLAVPESALIDEGGKAVAYVQVEGERFERRALTLGPRARGWVGVTAGLQGGEHVVTQGAYEIKLTAASGAIPQHGHVH